MMAPPKLQPKLVGKRFYFEVKTLGASRRSKPQRHYLCKKKSNERKTSVGSVAATAEIPTPVAAVQLEDNNVVATPSIHYSRKQKEVEDWNGIRDLLINGLSTTNVPGYYLMCSSCLKNFDTDDQRFRCLDCGPDMEFCHDCIINTHLKRVFHVPEIWQAGVFKPYSSLEKTIDTGHSDCLGSSWRFISVFDDKGRCHHVKCQFCSCEEEAATISKLMLWPLSPRNFSVAFSVGLLQWQKTLLLECQVSTKAFCNGLITKNNLGPPEAILLRKLERSECLFEYRSASHTLKHRFMEDDGTTCPACPKGPGPKFISMDANFGLVRRKKAGQSIDAGRHEGRIFISDEEVQDFVSSYDDSSTGTKECNQFKAGDKLRSNVKNAKLDVTGVFGAVCRHEFPLKFMNLQHGERLAYPVLLLKNLIGEAARKHQTLNVTYDIACVLSSHLKKRNQTAIVDAIKMAIPVFHCYGHKGACQVNFNPNRIEGFGLTDGEGIERLWSYLRRFAKVTKEMTPSHRVDVLTDGLLHYAMKKQRDIGKMLVQKHSKALKILESAEREMAEKIKLIKSVNINQKTIEEWKLNEKMILGKSYEPLSVTWQENYVNQLESLESIICRNSGPASDPQLFQRISNAVATIERTKGIQNRWLKGEAQYEDAQKTYALKFKANQLNKMLNAAQERRFFLGLKKKYFDGQAVAKRICLQINRTSRLLRKRLADYNSVITDKLLFSDVTDPDGDIYLHINENEVGTSVPFSVKRDIIKLDFKKNRAVEEIKMVEDEMRNVLTYYKQKELHCYTQLSQEMPGTPKYAILMHRFEEFRGLTRNCERLFCHKISEVEVDNARSRNDEQEEQYEDLNEDELNDSERDEIDSDEDDLDEYDSDVGDSDS